MVAGNGLIANTFKEFSNNDSIMIVASGGLGFTANNETIKLALNNRIIVAESVLFLKKYLIPGPVRNW